MHGSALQKQRNVSACLSLLLSWLLDADADAPPPLIVAQVFCVLGFLIAALGVRRIFFVCLFLGKLLQRSLYYYYYFDLFFTFLYVFERVQHASRGAGGRWSPGLIPRHTVRARVLFSRRHPRFSLPPLSLSLRCPRERRRWRTNRRKTARQNMCWRDAPLLTSITILPSRCVFPVSAIQVNRCLLPPSGERSSIEMNDWSFLL